MKSSYAEQFCLNSYSTMLQRLLFIGYTFSDFKPFNCSTKQVLLRHDVDNSLDYALKIAQLEFDLGIKSHFFVLIRTNFYNIFSANNELILKNILDMGHDVGLHFDASSYFSKENEGSDDWKEIENSARHECEILEGFLKTKVSCISFHRPAQHLMNHEGNFADRISTYNKFFFSEIGYCSDSGGWWKYGDPFGHVAIREGKPMQLLTHPIWWVEEGRSPKEKLENFLLKHQYNIKNHLAENNKTFV